MAQGRFEVRFSAEIVGQGWARKGTTAIKRRGPPGGGSWEVPLYRVHPIFNSDTGTSVASFVPYLLLPQASAGRHSGAPGQASEMCIHFAA